EIPALSVRPAIATTPDTATVVANREIRFMVGSVPSVGHRPIGVAGVKYRPSGRLPIPIFEILRAYEIEQEQSDVRCAPLSDTRKSTVRSMFAESSALSRWPQL